MSSAHINSFQQNGVFVVRNILSSQGDDAEQPARAVACRLLEAPACSDVASDCLSFELCVYVSDHDETVLGFDVGPGDIMVPSGDVARTASLPWKEALVACQADDVTAGFRDPLHGGRGNRRQLLYTVEQRDNILNCG